MDLKNNFKNFVKEIQNDPSDNKPELKSKKYNLEFSKIKSKAISYLFNNKEKVVIAKHVMVYGMEIFSGNKIIKALSHLNNYTADLVSRNLSFSDLFIEDDGWILVNFEELDYFYNEISFFPSQKTIIDNYSAVETIIINDDISLGIGYYQNEIDSVYIKSNLENPIDIIISKLFEIKMREENNGMFYIEKYKTKSGQERFKISVSSAPATFNSSSFFKIKNSFEKFLNKNINRSFALTGPPGTGKSTIAQNICSSFNLKTLKINCSNEHSFDMITAFIKVLKFDAIILDDFDYVLNNEKMLNILEVSNKMSKLTICIINNKEALAPALLRPGRVDELIVINHLDSESIKFLLGKELEHYHDSVKEWPVAFINELVKRSQVFPKEELDSHILELSERVKYQSDDEE